MNKDYSKLELNTIVCQKSIENEVDYQLSIPEYLNDLFRVIDCKCINSVNSVEINNNEVKLHINCQICLTYTNDNGIISYADFDENYTKLIDTDKLTDSAFACANITTKYISYRVINQRRIDVHISSTIAATVYDKQNIEYLSALDGAKLKNVESNVANIYSCKINTVDFDEDVSINSSTPVKRVVSCCQNVKIIESKIIDNKALIKLNTTLSMLYTTDEENEQLDLFEYSFETSKIVDITGIDENDILLASAHISNLYFKSRNPLNDNISVVQAYGSIVIDTVAIKEQIVNLVTDGYALKYKSNAFFEKYRLFTDSTYLTDSKQINLTFDINATTVDIKQLCISVNDIYFKNNLRIMFKLNAINLTDDSYSSITADSEYILDENYNDKSICNVQINNFDYTVKQNKIEVRANVDINYYHYNVNNIKILKDIEVFDEKCNSALTIYFANKGDSVWDIAKKLCSDADKIIAENNLDGDMINSNAVLIIPSA